MTAVPDAGFIFAGWTASSGGSYSSESLSFTMPQNADAGGVVLTAHFKADAHEHNYAEIEGTRVNPHLPEGRVRQVQVQNLRRGH